MNRIVLYLLISITIFADSFEFNHDNDIFITDEYYTSGVEFDYSKNVTSNKEEFYILGEKFYTPSSLLIEDPVLYDRPYAGWLYLTYGQTIKLEKSETRTGYTVGITGKNALGEFLQGTLHKIIGEEHPTGWNSQIESTIGIQYSYEMKNEKIMKNNDDNYISIIEHKGFEIGNIFTNFSYGNIFLIGNKTPFEESQKAVKYYFYYEPQLTFVLQDATLQGALFSEKSSVTKEINPFIIKNTIGAEVEYRDYIFNYAMNIQSTDVKSMSWKLSNHIYSRFSLKYLF